MPLSQLDKSLAAGLKPVYLIVGAQPYQLELAGRKISACVPLGAMSDMNTDTFYVGQDDLSGVPRLANSFPMMSKFRLVVLHDWHKAKARDKEALGAYLESPAEFTVVVMLAEKIDRREKVVKLSKEHGLTLEFERLYESKMRPWVETIAREQGVTVERDAIEYLIRAVGADLASVAQELEKAALHAGGQTVTAADLAAVMSSVREESYFGLFDAIAARDATEAMRILKEMLDQGQSAIGVLNMFGRSFRQLVVAKSLAAEPISEQQLARAIGTSPWAAKKTAGQARTFSDQTLRAGLINLAGVDLMLKDGRSHDRAILERLILDLCRRD